MRQVWKDDMVQAIMISCECSDVLTNHVETTCVAIKMHVLLSDLHIVVAVNTMRTGQKAK